MRRSTCRAVSGTSRRAASSTSAVGASRASTYRTALLSTTGTPCSAANRSIACARERSPWPRWCTTSSTSRPGPNAARQESRWATARSVRPVSSARPTGESGPSSAISPGACSAAIASELTGSPRVPRRWVALVSRHSDRQPAPSRARKVTRGSRGSTLAPPRAGARRAGARIRGGRRRTPPPRAGERRGQRGVQRRGDRQVDPEDRAHPRRPAGEGELHRAVEPVAVGQGQRRHAVLGGPRDQVGRMVGPVPHGVTGRDVQMDEGVIHRLERGRGAARPRSGER